MMKKINDIFSLVRGKLNSRNNLTLNILALISMGMMFLYTFSIGRVFGLTAETDIYFNIYNIVIYAGYFSQIFYECFVAFYADLKVKSNERADHLYSTLICQTVIFSIVIIILLNVLAPVIANYFLGSIETIGLIRILSIFILLQNLYLINKNKLNMNFKFKVSYMIEIGLFTLSTVLVFYFGNRIGIVSIIYSVLISYFCAVAVQSFFILKVLKTRFTVNFWHENTWQIVKGSIFVKSGSLLYGFKDVLIPQILRGAGPGVYSAYSYALKFATAVNNVMNAPNITVYSNEVNYMVSRKEYGSIFKKIRSLVAKLALMFSGAAAVSYFVIPVVIIILMPLQKGFIPAIQLDFMLLCIYFMMVLLDAPFMMVVSAFKRYEKVFLVNALFFVLFFILAKVLPGTAVYIIVAMCICQFTNFLAYMYFARSEIRKKRIQGTT